MGSDEAALVRLWREKRGEVEPEDLSGNLVVQLGSVTEDLNRHWYERNTGQMVTDVQRQVRHPVNRWMGATLDGMVAGDRGGVRGQVHAALVILRGGGRRKAHGAAPAQHVGHQCQEAVLSIITGGGKWVEITIPADRLYQHLLDHGGEEVLALCRDRGAPTAVPGRAAASRASRRCGWSI